MSKCYLDEKTNSHETRNSHTLETKMDQRRYGDTAIWSEFNSYLQLGEYKHVNKSVHQHTHTHTYTSSTCMCCTALVVWYMMAVTWFTCSRWPSRSRRASTSDPPVQGKREAGDRGEGQVRLYRPSICYFYSVLISPINCWWAQHDLSITFPCHPCSSILGDNTPLDNIHKYKYGDSVYYN